MARSTLASRTPRRASCSVTMRSLGMANSINTSGRYLSTTPARRKAPFSIQLPPGMPVGWVPDAVVSLHGSTGHGHPAVGHRVVIRVSQTLPLGLDSPNPVVGLAAWVDLADYGLAVDAAALASDHHATNGVGRKVGHIHVQEGVSR